MVVSGMRRDVARSRKEIMPIFKNKWGAWKAWVGDLVVICLVWLTLSVVALTIWILSR
jgi:hypothetical protein